MRAPLLSLRLLALCAWRGCAFGISLGAFVLAAAGCANWQPPPDTSYDSLRERSVVASMDEVRVRAAVLGTDDSRRIFGADVNARNIQPVWIEVENRSANALRLLRSGVDPDYYSPLEVAWSLHTPFAGETNSKIDDHLDAQGFQNPIPAGTTRAGVIFTNPSPKTKLLNVDLLANQKLIPFTLFLPVPGEEFDQLVHRYADGESTAYSDATEFRAALEQLPCCAMDQSGTVPGNPLNLIAVGDLRDLASAAIRRGFRRDVLEFDQRQRVFGRRPDVILRKHAQGLSSPSWIRAWLAPLQFQGHPVFVAQVGRPRGARLAAARHGGFILHPDVDETRNLLIQDMLYSGGLAKLGFVEGVGVAPADAPRPSLGGESYYTDGLRAVLFIATRPLGLEDFELLDWVPALERQEAKAKSEE